MDVDWKLFANLAERADREVTVTVEADATVGDALDALLEAHGDLEPLVLEGAALAGHVNLLQNGRDVFDADGLDTPVDADDELALFPPVSGG